MRLAGQAFADAPRLAGVPLIFNVRAFSIVMLLTWNLVRGIRESSWFNSAMVIVKLVILVFFMALGAFYVKLENWTPFAPNGWADITSAAVIIFFGYIGFDAVSTAAEETRQPQRNVPIGILASLAICTVLYFVVAVVLTGLMHGNQLDTAEPLAMAFSGLGLNWAVGIISVGALVANTSVLFVFQLGQPRIFFSMARDGLLSAWAAKVHPRHRTPHVTTILTGVLVAGFAGVMNINEVVELCNIGTLFAFVLVAAGILVLRHTDPDRRRSLRAAVSVGTVGRDPFLRLADGPVAARNLVALHSLARIWTADLLSLRIAAQPAEFSHQQKFLNTVHIPPRRSGAVREG